jgi:hypothetical protein
MVTLIIRRFLLLFARDLFPMLPNACFQVVDVAPIPSLA